MQETNMIVFTEGGKLIASCNLENVSFHLCFIIYYIYVLNCHCLRWAGFACS